MRAVINIAIRELKIIATTKSYYMILLILPPALFLLYTFIYNAQALHNIPVAIWDEDGTELSRTLADQYQSSPLVSVVTHVNSQEEVKELMQENRIQGAVHIPKGFQADISNATPTSVSFYRNASNLIFAELLYKAFAEITLTVNAGIILKRMTMHGVNEQQALDLANPVNVHTHSLYNPTYNYQNYLVPGLVTVGLQMMIIMIAVLIVNSEYENNTLQDLLKLAEGSSANIIIGKTAAHYAVGMMNVILIFGVLFTYFRIPFVHNLPKLFLLFSLLVLACIGIGIMVSVLFKEALMASDLALFYTSPAFVFSGFTFPKWAMPWYDQFYANLMPYTPFLMGFFKVYQMDAPWSSIMPHMVQLLWFILIPYSVAWSVLKVQLTQRKIASV